MAFILIFTTASGDAVMIVCRWSFDKWSEILWLIGLLNPSHKWGYNPLSKKWKREGEIRFILSHCLLSRSSLGCDRSLWSASFQLSTHHVVSWFPILTSDPLQDSPSCQRQYCPNFNHWNLPFSLIWLHITSSHLVDTKYIVTILQRLTLAEWNPERD